MSEIPKGRYCEGVFKGINDPCHNLWQGTCQKYTCESGNGAGCPYALMKKGERYLKLKDCLRAGKGRKKLKDTINR
jgi:hypothetical protein